MAGGGQRVAQAPDDQATHQGGVAEADLGLGRVDVDVDLERIDLDEQHGGGVAVAGEEVGIGAAQGALQQAVLHRAAVDEQILVLAVAARIGGQARKARQADLIADVVDQQGIGLEIAAEDGGEAAQAPPIPRVFGGQAQDGAALDVEGEADGLVRHGLSAQLLGNGHGLGALGLHEFEPGGGGVEQVAHLDPGAVRPGEGGGAGRGDAATLDAQGMGVAAGGWATGQRQPGDGADGGQGLAAKAQGVDAQQVDIARIVGLELGRRVALDGQFQLVRGHAVAVVGDQDAGQAAALDLHLDAGGAGVEGVLDQFLDGTGRALDHLAGGDAVDGLGGKAADGHGFGRLRQSVGGVFLDMVLLPLREKVPPEKGADEGSCCG